MKKYYSFITTTTFGTICIAPALTIKGAKKKAIKRFSEIVADYPEMANTTIKKIEVYAGKTCGALVDEENKVFEIVY